MAITETLGLLEAAVKDAKIKQQALDDANNKAADAQKAFSTALAEVDRLKNEVTSAIGDIFPQSNRIRVA